MDKEKAFKLAESVQKLSHENQLLKDQMNYINKKNTITIYVFIRLAGSCRIESYILYDSFPKWELVYNELENQGWRLTDQSNFELNL